MQMYKKTRCGQLHLQTLAKESYFYIQETRKQVAPKATAQGSFLIPSGGHSPVAAYTVYGPLLPLRQGRSLRWAVLGQAEILPLVIFFSE